MSRLVSRDQAVSASYSYGYGFSYTQGFLVTARLIKTKFVGSSLTDKKAEEMEA